MFYLGNTIWYSNAFKILNLQLVFEGSVGSSTSDYVTVDDVAVLDRSCKSNGKINHID